MIETFRILRNFDKIDAGNFFTLRREEVNREEGVGRGHHMRIGAFLSGKIVTPDRSNWLILIFFRHWITIGFKSDHGPELSAVISLRGRISANRDVTIKTKTFQQLLLSGSDSVFGLYCYQISMMF